MPLLAREMTQQAARVRTYVFRAVYIVVLCAFAGFFLLELINDTTGSPLDIIGQGGNLFMVVVGVQFFGIYLLLPAMACGAITREKERDTLTLMLTTRLGPSTIVLEKLLARLVPVWMFLITSLPVMGLAYSLGGLSQPFIWGGFWILTITAIQIASVALLCSVWFASTVSAFLFTYGIVFVWSLGMPIANGLFDITRNYDLIFTFFPPYHFINPMGGKSFPDVFVDTLPILVCSLVLLVIARGLLVVRATPRHRDQPEYVHSGQTKKADKSLSPRIRMQGLPDDEPVAWRETQFAPLSRPWHLLLLFLFVESPTLFCCFVLLFAWRYDEYVVTCLFFYCSWWTAAALLVIAKASSLAPSERSKQTLDILLSTPMTGRQIVAEKMRGTLAIARRGDSANPDVRRDWRGDPNAGRPSRRGSVWSYRRLFGAGVFHVWCGRSVCVSHICGVAGVLRRVATGVSRSFAVHVGRDRLCVVWDDPHGPVALRCDAPDQHGPLGDDSNPVQPSGSRDVERVQRLRRIRRVSVAGSRRKFRATRRDDLSFAAALPVARR